MSWNVYQANSTQADNITKYLKEGTIRRWFLLRCAEFSVCDTSEVFFNVRVAPFKVIHFHCRVHVDGSLIWIGLEFMNSLNNQRYDVHCMSKNMSDEFVAWRDRIVELMTQRYQSWLKGAGV